MRLVPTSPRSSYQEPRRRAAVRQQLFRVPGSHELRSRGRRLGYDDDLYPVPAPEKSDAALKRFKRPVEIPMLVLSLVFLVLLAAQLGHAPLGCLEARRRGGRHRPLDGLRCRVRHPTGPRSLHAAVRLEEPAGPRCRGGAGSSDRSAWPVCPAWLCGCPDCLSESIPASAGPCTPGCFRVSLVLTASLAA